MIQLDTSGGTFTTTLEDAAVMKGKTVQFILDTPGSSDGGFDAVIAAAAGQDINGLGSFNLIRKWASALLVSNGVGWRLFASSEDVSSTGTVGGGDSPVPGDVTLLATFQSDFTDIDGKAKKRITVTYTPPVGGVFEGVWKSCDDPDSSAGLQPADGTHAADGTIPAVEAFKQDDYGYAPYDGKTPQFNIVLPAPKVSQYWRIYATSGTTKVHKKLVQHGTTGESPSIVAIVNPPTPSGKGVEYAPNIVSVVGPPSYIPTGWAANPAYDVNSSGDQHWTFAFSFGWPTWTADYANLGGFDVVIDDGFTQTVISSISVGGPTTYSSPSLVLPPGSTVYTVWLPAWDKGGNRNSIVPITTPSFQVTVTRQLGPAGIEYAPLVVSDGTHPFITVANRRGSDGGYKLIVTGYWKNIAPTDPAYDPTFGGAEIVVLEDDGNYYTIAQGAQAPISNEITDPIATHTWKFFVRSISGSGNKRNSIVLGVTPEVDIAVGSTVGTFDISYTNSGYNTSHFNFDTFGNFQVANGAIGTAQLTTSSIDVGNNGSGKPIRIRVYDHAGALIGWIGDDLANSGFVGAWFKTVYIGGTNPSTAPIIADSSGAVKVSSLSIIGGNFQMSDGFGHVCFSVVEAGGSLINVNNGAIQCGLFTSSLGYYGMVGGVLGIYIDVAAGMHNFPLSAATATAGAGTLPASPVGFFKAQIGGTEYRVPYYNI